MSGSSIAVAAVSPFPLDAARWAAVVEHLKLGPQQVRIAEMVILGRGDKEIAVALGIAKPTLRGYLVRLYQRVKVENRLQLVVRLLCVAVELEAARVRHHA
ncbi:MAG: LuxR C-terminal-related transcriptional regulator [Phycisphaerales bacterium]